MLAPFADAREITIVRPVAKLSLSDYEIDPKLISRLSDHHRGVFICGRPGSGKTTLAQAIAEYLDEDVGAMVKTMELLGIYNLQIELLNMHH